jgi:hypothetical protein
LQLADVILCGRQLRLQIDDLLFSATVFFSWTFADFIPAVIRSQLLELAMTLRLCIHDLLVLYAAGRILDHLDPGLARIVLCLLQWVCSSSGVGSFEFRIRIVSEMMLRPCTDGTTARRLAAAAA